MKFEIDAVDDAAQSLRNLEPQAPKHLKAVMLQAAAELERRRETMTFVAEQLEFASKLRVGAMDTNSRASEIMSQLTNTASQCAIRLKDKP